jgi:hypothetical protein
LNVNPFSVHLLEAKLWVIAIAFYYTEKLASFPHFNAINSLPRRDPVTLTVAEIREPSSIMSQITSNDTSGAGCVCACQFLT